MEGLRSAFRNAMGKTLQGMTAVDRLAAAWTVACGSAMAARGSVVDYSDGVVRVEVSDDAWLRQMLAVRAQLEGDLQRISGIALSRIEFERKLGSR